MIILRAKTIKFNQNLHRYVISCISVLVAFFSFAQNTQNHSTEFLDSIYVAGVEKLQNGDEYFSKGEYQKGMNEFQSAFDDFLSINDESYCIYCKLKIYHGNYVLGNISEIEKQEEILVHDYSDCLNHAKHIDNEILLILASTVANIFKSHNLYKEAIELRKEIYEFEKELYKNDIKFMFPNLYSLITLYVDVSDIDNAQKLLDEALKVFEQDKSLLHESIELALLQCHVYNVGGNPAKGIDYCEKIYPTIESMKDETILNGWNDFYSSFLASVGRFEDSLSVRNNNLKRTENIYGDKSQSYARALLNLAEMNSVVGNYDEAHQQAQSALTIMETLYGNESREYYQALSKHVATSRTVGDMDIASKYNELINLSEKIFGEQSPEYANALIYSIDISGDINDTDINKFEKAIDIKKRLGLNNNSDYVSQLSWLVLLYRLNNDWANCLVTAKETLNQGKNFISSNFLSLTDDQRQAIWHMINPAFDGIPCDAAEYAFYAYETKDYSMRNDFGALAYDCRLFQKGLLLSSAVKLNRLLDSSNNERINQLREEIASLNSDLTYISEPNKISLTKRHIQENERELINIAASLGNYTEFININWKDIQHKLSPGEIALEFFTYPAGNRVQYAAVWVSDNRPPVAFPLFCEDELTPYMTDSDTKFDYNSPDLYKVFWGTLEAFFDIDKSKTIYFSPDGILNILNIECLMDSTGVQAQTKRNLYRLSSTREITDAPKAPKGYLTSSLYGGLTYTVDNLNELSEAQYNQSGHTQKLDRSYINESLRYGVEDLPNSLEEVEDIAKMLNSKGISSKLFTKEIGTEECFKSQAVPSILHLATHGFFWNDDMASTHNYIGFLQNINPNDNPAYKAMKYSGLFLSGANQALSGKPIPEYAEDGILTADEVSNIQLNGNDLVVLSACQTGLGESTSEGVFGLQRGFKLAGAKALLMSLWKVDDEATMVLMTEFYRNLLDGKTKVESLKLAQEHVRNTPGWEHPKYWAAWILLDALN